MNAPHWEPVAIIDLEPGDVVLSAEGPARVRGWIWRPHQATLTVTVIATGRRLTLGGSHAVRVRPDTSREPAAS